MVGIHSGPVTAGVLRGERQRFQLFGDTMNTTARIESTSRRGCIQVSQETANLLCEAGKENWLKPREDKILAKGKGDMQTFWLKVKTLTPSPQNDATTATHRENSSLADSSQSIKEASDGADEADTIASPSNENEERRNQHLPGEHSLRE